VMQLQSEEGRNISLRCRVTGIPEASITWGQNNRLLANGTSLLNIWDSEFFQISEFYSDSNTKVSELFILDIRHEDQGNYFCSGKNAAGSARANFTITVIKRRQNTKENTTQESKQMFKVEYILGFGAAVVIVLTIIIVLILYLILQCRQKRRERQLRKLICDSRSSDSFAERSTVDYIVPGEMELISAVRSVSCNSSMSKCNKTEDDDEYGPNVDGPPLIDSLFVKQNQSDCPPPPPPPNGTSLSCSNPDLVQDTKLWDRNVHKPSSGVDSYRGLNGSIPSGGTYAPHQYFPPRIVYPHNFPMQNNPRLQFMPNNGFAMPQYLNPGPPQYRHPPPVSHNGPRDLDDENINETVLSAANLNGSPMPHYYSHCDTMNNLMWSQQQVQQSMYPTYIQQHGYRNQAFEHTKDCPRSRPIGGYGMTLQPRQEPYLTHHQTQNQFSQPGQMRPEPPMQCRPGQLGYPNGQDYHNQYSYGPPPYCHPPLPQWSAEEEEMKYGPFSDGEAETLRRGTRSCKKTMRARGTPHYATMSRAHELASYKQQSSLESNDGHNIKYTSQPHLNGSVSDYLGQRPPHSDILTPLSIKTSITFPRQKPHEKSKHSVPSLKRQENVRMSHDSGPPPQNYPDLARHPLSYSAAPPPTHNGNRYSRSIPQGYQGQFPNQMSQSFVQNRQNSSDEGHFEYEHSRSSSVGDIHWGMNGNPDIRMATPDGFSSLPYDSVKLAVNGVKKRTVRSGAVKVDLSWADKSIRRPGSAPDLVGVDEVPHLHPHHNSPGANSLRDNKKGGSLKDRARSTSSESREPPPPKKPGVSPGTRKVAFAGIEDEDSDSESEKQSRDSITSFDEDVWVKQPDPPKRPSEELVPTTGVVIAQAQPCSGFTSSKLQQNKCNGIR